MFRLPMTAAAAIAGVIACTPAAAQVQRTFVASYGSDSNAAANCTLSAPCRSFATAHNATVSGGEIVALDAAGYGRVVITKSISILANPGVYAGISVAGGDAVSIEGNGLSVRLSGLKINNTGDGIRGISMGGYTSSLSIENCTVTGFVTNGIWVIGPGSVRIVDTVVSENGFNGIQIGGGVGDIVNSRAFGNLGAGFAATSQGPEVTRVSVTNSIASGNYDGFRANTALTGGGLAQMFVSGSTADHNWNAGFRAVAEEAGTTAIMSVSTSKATRNGKGFRTLGAGTSIINSAGNNAVQENDTDVAGTVTNIGTM